MRRCALVTIILLAELSVAAGQALEGKSTNVPTVDGDFPPVARAVVAGNIDEVVALVQKQPQVVNEIVPTRNGGRAGFTPIILAAALSNTDIVKYLMKENADITKLDDYHRSVLWYAAFNGDLVLTQIVLSIAGPLVVTKVINIPDSDLMRTPLHLALRRNEPQLVRTLIGAGASEESKDYSGETPVQFCERNRTVSCKEFLKLKGLQ